MENMYHCSKMSRLSVSDGAGDYKEKSGSVNLKDFNTLQGIHHLWLCPDAGQLSGG